MWAMGSTWSTFSDPTRVGSCGIRSARLCPSCCKTAAGRLRVVFIHDPVARHRKLLKSLSKGFGWAVLCTWDTWDLYSKYFKVLRNWDLQAHLIWDFGSWPLHQAWIQQKNMSWIYCLMGQTCLLLVPSKSGCFIPNHMNPKKTKKFSCSIDSDWSPRMSSFYHGYWFPNKGHLLPDAQISGINLSRFQHLWLEEFQHCQPSLKRSTNFKSTFRYISKSWDIPQTCCVLAIFPMQNRWR